MTCKYYIGIRLHSSEMAKVNGGNTAQLNTSMSSTLGSAAMGMGIKKTQSGKSLNFFPVSESDYEFFTSESSKSFIPLSHSIDWWPLISVDKDMMMDILDSVNKKYGNRMDRETHKKYQSELIEALTPCLTKLNEDKVIPRKPPRRTRHY